MRPLPLLDLLARAVQLGWKRKGLVSHLELNGQRCIHDLELPRHFTNAEKIQLCLPIQLGYFFRPLAAPKIFLSPKMLSYDEFAGKARERLKVDLPSHILKQTYSGLFATRMMPGLDGRVEDALAHLKSRLHARAMAMDRTGGPRIVARGETDRVEEQRELPVVGTGRYHAQFLERLNS